MKVSVFCLFLACQSLAWAEEAKGTNPLINQKPRLEDFATYNDFLRAMYLHKKNEEETTKPTVIINPPSKGQSQPEYSPMDKERDITSWGEDIPAQSPTPLD